MVIRALLSVTIGIAVEAAMRVDVVPLSIVVYRATGCGGCSGWAACSNGRAGAASR